MKYQTGLCSWSLQNNPERVAQTMNLSGLTHLHLDIHAADNFRNAITSNGWKITSTMIAFPQEDYSTLDSIRQTGGIIPDDCWPSNRELVFAAIGLTADMHVPYLSTHAGFIDHADATGYSEFCRRMKELADKAAEKGIMLLMETGQETAAELNAFLGDLNHPALAVNFDPANMLLYGKGDPAEAVKILAPWIKHVHIKDAIASPLSGEWGQEVPWGDGEVNISAFFQALEQIGFDGALAIEREAGSWREQDILHAAKELQQLP